MGNILTKQFYRQRKDFEDSCAGRDAGLTFPEGVRCSTDIAYADDGIKAHMLDIYRLEDSQEKILCTALQEGISCIQHRVQADSRLSYI